MYKASFIAAFVGMASAASSEPSSDYSEALEHITNHTARLATEWKQDLHAAFMEGMNHAPSFVHPTVPSGLNDPWRSNISAYWQENTVFPHRSISSCTRMGTVTINYYLTHFNTSVFPPEPLPDADPEQLSFWNPQEAAIIAHPLGYSRLDEFPQGISAVLLCSFSIKMDRPVTESELAAIEKTLKLHFGWVGEPRRIDPLEQVKISTPMIEAREPVLSQTEVMLFSIEVEKIDSGDPTPYDLFIAVEVALLGYTS